MHSASIKHDVIWVQHEEVQEGHIFLSPTDLELFNFGSGLFGYTDEIWPKEHSPDVWHIPPRDTLYTSSM
jgi:hypothetical protein